MKIAVFAAYDLAFPGGIGSHVRAQARALRALGHTVSVFGPASAALPPDEVALSASTRVRFGGTASGAALNPGVFATVGRLFAREPFDVVHVHEPLMPLLPWAAVWCARAPVVATFHVYREGGHRWYPRARLLLQRIVDRIHTRIAVSEPARRTIARYFPGEYQIVPNGIEPARFRRAYPRPAGLPAAGPIVLCVGRLEHRKGVAVLIDAMHEVRQQIRDATLLIVGDGPDYDALAARGRQLAIPLQFFREVNDDTLPAFYQACDVCCAPAIGGESFGIVLIEALAAGRPVVASRIDGYVDAVGNLPGVGWAAPGDAVSLARALIHTLQERRTLADAETARVAARYDWTRIAAQLDAIYRTAAAGAAHT